MGFMPRNNNAGVRIPSRTLVNCLRITAANTENEIRATKAVQIFLDLNRSNRRQSYVRFAQGHLCRR